MGIYVNPGNAAFEMSRFSDIYIDKSLLIAHINAAYRTERRFICVSRPRRFGKSMAANMLSAYYSQGCDSSALFTGLAVRQNGTYERHLNRHNVIRLDIQRFLFQESHLDIFIDKIQKVVMKELRAENGNCFAILYSCASILCIHTIKKRITIKLPFIQCLRLCILISSSPCYGLL